MGEPDQGRELRTRRGRTTAPAETPKPADSTANSTVDGSKTGFSNKLKNAAAGPTITDQNGQPLEETALESIKADSLNIEVDGIPLSGAIMDKLAETDITSAQDALNIYNKIQELIQADKLNVGSEAEQETEIVVTGRGGRSRAATPTHQEQQINMEVFNGAQEVASIEGSVKPDIPEIMKSMESAPAIDAPVSNKGLNN